MSPKQQPPGGIDAQAGTGLNSDIRMLKFLENKSIASLENALSAVRELSAARLDSKLSVARLAGVARELSELIKVMSVYGC